MFVKGNELKEDEAKSTVEERSDDFGETTNEVAQSAKEPDGKKTISEIWRCPVD